ncbi:MAG: hypothetical protein E7256_04065 [Lachnospiraceae bacterium]|nr:hypothetical protein [Lachnospiraceae bacterium]
MKNKKFLINMSRLLTGVMVFSTFAPVPITVAATEEMGSKIMVGQNDMNTQADDSDPYFRADPGLGQVPIEITAPTNNWTTRQPLDNRVPADFAGGTYKMISYPFADSEGKSDLLQINYVHNGKSTFGGITLESPLSPAVEVSEGSTIEFDVYYPKSAQGKYMRWRIRTTYSNVDTYMRDYEYNNLNPDWIGSYNGETWLKVHHSITASTGMASNFILELHGENARPAETGMLLVGDIKITTPDPEGTPLPDVVNSENEKDVKPLKSVYNKENGLFMVGAIGTGTVNGTRARHYEIFVDGNNLKAEGTHPYGPNWLTSVTGEPLNGANTTPGLGEYRFPTNSYLAIRDSGTAGEYKSHGHVLAWYNQAPGWMRQMIPAHLASGYTGTSEFYGLGNGVTTTVAVDKEMARRVQFNHTMYVMRHFLSTDEKYGSSESRGIIPFNSWDVLNEEVHESRHSEIIPTDANSWRTSLKHTNWLVAMSDDEISGDITEHYIYLLFKYAHIAVPNAKMAAAYKANYASLPEYMKLDGHDTDGSIDAYVVDEPPKLTYNDYGTATRTKARTIYNMALELNTAWLSDPLYDGRPLIEVIGFQGHDSVGKTLASDNQYAMALCASLIDKGLLSGISFSELDLKLLPDAPGGGATAPEVLNVRQSDALGYQYALLYKMFAKFAPYIDHIMSWGVAGSGWQGSYVLFDQNNNANAGYYGAMDPDRFILGHSYLDDYFAGEYEKVSADYAVDLGDLGTYVPGTNSQTAKVTTSTPKIDVSETAYVSLHAGKNFAASEFTVTYDPELLHFDPDASVLNGAEYVESETGVLNFTDYGEENQSSYTLAYKPMKGGEAVVAVSGAAFGTQKEAETMDLTKTDLTPDSVIITILAGDYKVNLDEIYTGAASAAEGENYTFAPKDNVNYTYGDPVVTVGGIKAEVIKNEDGSWTVPNVNGDVVVTGTRTPKSYSIKFAYDGDLELTLPEDGTVTYGEDFSFKLPTSNVHGIVAEVMINGVAYTPTVQGGVVTVLGTDISGDISVRFIDILDAARVEIGGSAVNDVVNFVAYATPGEDYVLNLNKNALYKYAVTATINGKAYELTVNGDAYIVKGADFAADDVIAFNVEKTLILGEVEKIEYMKLDGAMLQMIVLRTKRLECKVYTYNGQEMLWSDKYDAYVLLNIIQDGAADVTDVFDLVEGKTVSIDYSGDVNMTGRVDMNDAQLIYNMYNLVENGSIRMEKYLRADVNGDMKINVLDAAMIVNTVLN